MYRGTLMSLQVGQQPPQRSGSQQLTLSAVEKGEAAVNTKHFINAILRGMGHPFRAPTQGEEGLHRLQTQVPARRSRAGGPCRADGLNTAPWGRLGRYPLFTEPLQ